MQKSCPHNADLWCVDCVESYAEEQMAEILKHKGECGHKAAFFICNKCVEKSEKEARAEALEEAARCADDQEKVHHKYADSYEEGMRDMADLLGQGIRALKAKP